MLDDTPRAFLGRAIFCIVGMRGGSCERAVSEEVCGTPGVIDAVADTTSGTLTVTVNRAVDRAQIAAAVRRAGYYLRW